MAEAYLTEVRAFQPKGPYLFAGYSGGGLVALEMAQRVAKLGERVDLVAFIDTFHPQMPIRSVTMARRLERLRDERLDYFRAAYQSRKERYEYGTRIRQLDEHLARGGVVPPELREADLTRAFERAHHGYVPGPWSGPATLFRAEEVAYIYQGAGPTYGWDALIPKLDVVRVPGNHQNLLLEPNASILVRSLGVALDAIARAHAAEGIIAGGVGSPSGPASRPPPASVRHGGPSPNAE
jgi:thioesterase domain-containing protein